MTAGKLIEKLEYLIDDLKYLYPDLDEENFEINEYEDNIVKKLYELDYLI